jgi:hypothetical protein
MPSFRHRPHRLSLFPLKESLVFLSLACAALAASAAPADSDTPSPEFEQAQRESANGHFSAAKEKLAAILGSPAARPEDRAAAGTELARIEWRIDGQPDAARERLARLIPDSNKKVQPLLLLSRMERSLLRFDAAGTAARQALAASEGKEDRLSSTTMLAHALVEEDVLAAHDGKAAAFGETSRTRLREALDLVAPIVREYAGLLGPSQVQLDAALLLDDGPATLKAWRSYFTAAGTADSTLLANARAVLDELLPRWRGPAASRADREALVRALADSRFFTEAVLVAMDPRPPEAARVSGLPWVKDLELYESYVRNIRETTDLYYRDVARGKADASAWKRELTKATEALWNGLSWPNGAPPFDKKALEGALGGELDTRFGTVADAGMTGGIPNLHMGHRVIDEKRTAEQYGRRATIHFIALDAMVSNGYETWMWDGHGAHGGWGETGLIVQARPAYAGGALYEWQELTDPERRTKADVRTAEETSRDDERAAKDPYAHLPGLALRLRRQGLQRVLDELTAKGVSGAALQTAFVAAVDRAVIESSIFAHEGRHAIDAEFETHFFGFFLGWGFRSSAALEYRAKLSEIAFAPAPRLAFGGILNGNIGSATPHGQANLKLMKGLVSWMNTHRAEIAGLDPKKPLLPQLDKLTDDQLRDAARSLDPMASGTR